MTLHVEIEKDFSESINVREIAFRVADKTLSKLSCPYEADVSLILTDDDAIREINRETRNIDLPTDVLSFPCCEYTSPANFDCLLGQMDIFDPETGNLILGDIVISADRAEMQASEYGHSITREFAFLVAHSMLHLCGYDHVTDDECKAMEEMQRIILNELGIYR